MMGLFVFISVVLTLIISYIWGQKSLSRVKFRHYFKKQNALFGDQLNYTQELTNDKILPLPWILIRTEVPEEVRFLKGSLSSHYKVSRKILAGIFSARWYEKVIRKYPILCSSRGMFFFGPAEIRSGDILGFFQKTMNREETVKIIVFPKVLEIKSSNMLHFSLTGENHRQSFVFQDPYSYIGTRDYVPGDSFKSIHWKATARKMKLQTMVYDASLNKKLAIILNVNTFEHPWEGINTSAVELAIITAASIASRAIRDGCEVMLVSNTRMVSEKMDTELITVIPYGRGFSHLKVLLESLSRLHDYGMQPIEKVTLKILQKIKPQGQIIFITPLLNQQIEKILRMIDRKGFKLQLVLIGDRHRETRNVTGIKTYRVLGEESWRDMEEIRLV